LEDVVWLRRWETEGWQEEERIERRRGGRGRAEVVMRWMARGVSILV